MQDKIKMLAEKFLGIELSQEFYEIKKVEAVKKLDRIISREGDMDGERRQPYYLAQHIAERVKEDVTAYRCMMDFETKKEAARKSGQLFNQPHYSTS